MEEGSENASDLMLIIEKGPRKGENIGCHAGSTVRIGRIIKGNTFTIKDPSISQNHLLIQFDGLHWSISDLDTSNGTFLNGLELPPNSPRPLSHADIIKIGSTTSMTVRIIDHKQPQRNARRGQAKKAQTETVPKEQINSVVPDLEIVPPRRNLRRRGAGAADSKERPVSCRESNKAGKVYEKMPVEDNVGVGGEMGTIGLEVEEKGNPEVVPPLRNLRSRAVPARVTRAASKGKGVSEGSDAAAKVDEKIPLGDNVATVDERIPLGDHAAVGAEVPSNAINVKEEMDSESVPSSQNLRSQAAPVETGVSSENNIGPENCREEKAAAIGDNSVGREDVGVDKKKELEKITLGEWFDRMEKYLPQQVNEAAEEIIERLRQRQKQFEDFLIERQCNVKGKMPITG